MKTLLVLGLFYVALFPTTGFAKNAQTKVEPIPTARKVPPPVADLRPAGIVRQDLFDRSNPNNLRSDYRAPPAQPRPVLSIEPYWGSACADVAFLTCIGIS